MFKCSVNNGHSAAVRVARAVAALSMAILPMAPALAQSTIIGLHRLLPDNSYSPAVKHVVAVSRDGLVVTGYGDVPGSGRRIFRWTRETGDQDLGAGTPVVMNPDGRAIAGVTGAGNGNGIGWIWTADAGMQTLPNTPGCSISCISESGAVVGGQAGLAFRWTAQGGTQSLGVLDGWSGSGVRSMSADGARLVGLCTKPCEIISNDTETGFVWTTQSGMVPWSGSGTPASDTRLITADGTTIFGVEYPDGLCSGQAQGRIVRDHGGALSIVAPPPNYSGAVLFGDTSDGAYLIGWGAGVGQPNRPCRWNGNGIVLDLGLPPGTENLNGANGRVVSKDGSRVLAIGSQGDFIWDQTAGWKSLIAFLASQNIAVDRWSNLRAVDMSEDGLVLVGDGTLDGIQTCWMAEYRKDSDGDGVPDDWEICGIPYRKTSGEIGRYILPEADPARKNIWVEVDAMAGHAPTEATLHRVVDAFGSAPVPAPTELVPGYTPSGGVKLHVDIDETDIADQAFVGYPWAEFGPIYTARSGTYAERHDVDGTAILHAKRRAYRYCVFVREISQDDLGLAILDTDRPAAGPRRGGGFFMIGLGNYVLSPTQDLGDLQAAAFMHELGHSLGLYHGGTDHENFKPNFYSLMNWMWSGARPWGEQGPSGHVRLDYSRQKLPTLRTNNLDEMIGIRGDQPISGPPLDSALLIPIVVNYPAPVVNPACQSGICDHANVNRAGTCVNFVHSHGPVDWDNDGCILSHEIVTTATPSWLSSVDHLPVTDLESCTEWDLLSYPVNVNVSGIAGALASLEPSAYFANLPLPPPCINQATDKLLFETVPPNRCPGLPPAPGSPSPIAYSTCEGLDATFSISPTGQYPFAFQWRRFDATQSPPWVNLVDGVMASGTGVQGAQTSSIRLINALLGDLQSDVASGRCRLTCVVLDFCGQTASSTEGVLSFAGPVLATVVPTTQALCLGQSVLCELSVQGRGPFTYHWEAIGLDIYTFSNGVLPNGTSVQGADGPVLSLGNTDSDDFGVGTDFYISCRVTDSCNQQSWSDGFLVHIGGPIVTLQPNDLDRPCAGAADAIFSVGAAGSAPLVYQWSKDGTPLADDAGGHVAGSTTPTLTVAAPIAADAGSYTCTVSNACGAATSSGRYLNIGPPRLLADPPAPFQVCPGGQGIIHVQAIGTQPLAFQWMRNGVDLADGNRPSGTQIFGSQTDNLFINDVTTADTGAYTVRIQNACGTIVSQPATSVVFEPPAIAAQPTNKLTCPTGSVTLSLQPAGDATNLGFVWQVEDPSAPDGWSFIQDASIVIDGAPCATVVGDVFSSSLTVSWAGLPECGPSHRFRCYEVSSCGYILSDPATVRICKADFNCSGALAVSDIFAFLNAWFAGSPSADINGGGLAVSDIFAFLNDWFDGC